MRIYDNFLLNYTLEIVRFMPSPIPNDISDVVYEMLQRFPSPEIVLSRSEYYGGLVVYWPNRGIVIEVRYADGLAPQVNVQARHRNRKDIAWTSLSCFVPQAFDNFIADMAEYLR